MIKSLPTLTLGLAICAASMTGAPAADWPQRPVRIITSFPVGTGGDIAARLYADRLVERWNKPVIVENRPGADGILAVTAGVGARDSHTLVFINGGPLTSNKFSHDTLPYDADADLQPISMGIEASVVASVPSSLKVNSINDFLTYSQSHPGQLNWSATAGALDYLVPKLFKRHKLDLQYVGYKEIAPAMQDLAEARIHFYVSALATQLGSIKAGKATPIVVTNQFRNELIPQVPTVHEVGVEELGLEAFVAFFAPRDVPADVVAQIGSDIRIVGAEPALKERLVTSGFVPRTTSPEELKAVIAAEREKIASSIAMGLGRR
jgi:tripartite-type tricarboxylate transporter receptor subunit TctC